MEISMTLDYIDSEIAKNMLIAHPAEYLLFGTDSPWTNQQNTLNLLKNLKLGSERENLILRGNAMRLLGL